MKVDIRMGLILSVAAVVLCGCATERAPNPIVRHMFTADPSAHVWGDGRLYVYPSTDVAPARGCDRMDGYHAFSTDDLLTWTDHGEILHSKDVEWGRPEGGFMWAPDCAYRDGIYYYYFPHPSDSVWNDSWKIGVASSTSPTEGFEDKGYIDGIGGRAMIDPAVFTDDDGQAYMVYGGGGTLHIGKLKENMMTIDGDMVDISDQLDDFHEGPWVFKRDGIYYLVYPDNMKPCNNMLYAMSSGGIFGPWISKGILMDSVTSQTMHGSVIDFKGQWYIFYHNAALSGGIGNLRSICFDKLIFNKDGTIRKVVKTQPLEDSANAGLSGNPVKNSSFEEGVGHFIYGWKTTTANLIRCADTVKGGEFSLKYQGIGIEPVTQRVSILPNTDYQLSVSIKTTPDSKGSAIFDTNDLFDESCQFVIPSDSGPEWVEKTGTFNSGSHDSVNFRCFTSANFNGICYWDEVILEVIE